MERDGFIGIPVGTVIAKAFAYRDATDDQTPGERFMETRIEHHEASGWYGYSYVWNESAPSVKYELQWRMAQRLDKPEDTKSKQKPEDQNRIYLGNDEIRHEALTVPTNCARSGGAMSRTCRSCVKRFRMVSTKNQSSSRGYDRQIIELLSAWHL